MKARGVRLQYSFGSDGQSGSDVANPLFDLIAAVRERGSIQAAATSMGMSYRHVWGLLKQWEDQLGESLIHWSKGRSARLTPFAERLLWAEARARVRLSPQIEALRVELQRVLAEALDGDQQVLKIHASHDLLLPRLRDFAAQSHQLHIDLRFAGSMDALRALAEGRCELAGFHVPVMSNGHNVFGRSLKPLLKPGRHKLIGCARRTQGLMVPRGNPHGIASLRDVAEQGLRFIGRQAGSGTELLKEFLLEGQGTAPLPPLCEVMHEDSHVAVAAAVASDVGDAGLGIQAAARAFGLDFLPLAEEDYFLVCLSDVLDEPPVRALREVLRDARWISALASSEGYSTAASGEVLSLTRALPWWSFRKPKPRRHADESACPEGLPLTPSPASTRRRAR